MNEVSYVLRHFSPHCYHRLDRVQRPTVNLLGDICQIPLADSTVNHALLWHVLEHITDDLAAMRELYRVLHPGGSLLVSVPIHRPGRERTLEDPTVPLDRYEQVFGHREAVRACGIDYCERFRNAGFMVTELRAQHISESDRRFFGLNDVHVAWCCTK